MLYSSKLKINKNCVAFYSTPARSTSNYSFSLQYIRLVLEIVNHNKKESLSLRIFPALSSGTLVNVQKSIREEIKENNLTTSIKKIANVIA